jgi:hypothetical protein
MAAVTAAGLDGAGCGDNGLLAAAGGSAVWSSAREIDIRW